MDYKIIEDKVLDLDISPYDYEIYCMELLKRQMLPGFTDAEDVIIEHNKIIEKDEQRYQFDIYCKFSIGKLAVILLAGECKRYKNKVAREKIQAFRQKLTDAGIHKGVFFSTSGYQSGAITYAQNNNIALCQFTTKKDLNIFSFSKNEMPNSIIGAWVYNLGNESNCRPIYPDATNRFVDWVADSNNFK